MARLNEPPAPTESVDSLKRRFIRQNREIARVNSTQSLRIRSLEAETSRLLSENIGLREDIIRLRHELDKSCRRNGIGSVKSKFEDKLAELGKLVNELGFIGNDESAALPTIQRRYDRISPKRSPDQRNWKNALTLSEVTGGQDGRLPPIVEGKYFPRKTLDCEELIGILSDPINSVDSPDLEPPPVAHFDGRYALKVDSCERPAIQEIMLDQAELVPPLSSNLETRRKRRVSSLDRSLEDTSNEENVAYLNKIPSTVKSGVGIGQSLKAGAKRKLSSRDDDARNHIQIQIGKDGFDFNRKSLVYVDNLSSTGSTGDIRNHKVSEDLAAVEEKSTTKARNSNSVTSTMSGRHALGEKSVNTDPIVSPIKASKPSVEDKITDSKNKVGSGPRDRARTRDKKVIGKEISRPSQRQKSADIPSQGHLLPQVKTVEILPATPAQTDLDLFSPVSTEPSTARPGSRDTPPPPDIDDSNAAARATRRPRGSVSYAEPNLRDKMRRPTKQLVDAVGADERVQRATSAKPETGGANEEDVAVRGNGSEKGRTRTVYIKKEDSTTDRSSWKSLASIQDDEKRREERIKSKICRAESTSPLGGKSSHVTATADLPMSVNAERRRSTAMLDPDEGNANPDIKNQNMTSGSGTGIAGLMAGSKYKKGRAISQSVQDGEGRGEKGNHTKDSADIFAFKGSPPADASDDGTAGGLARLSKRSMSVPDSLQKVTEINASITDTKVGLTPAAASRSSRRRETLAAEAGFDGPETQDSSVKSSIGAVKAVINDEIERDSMGPAKQTLLSRAERAASRRRSMKV